MRPDPLKPLREGKVALCGTAPDTIGDAPWKDESWEIWGIGPGLCKYADTHHWDRWWEIHGVRENKFIGESIRPEYYDWLVEAQHKGTLYLRDAEDQKYLPNGVLYPVDAIVERFGDFFCSSLSWMLALAIHLDAKQISLFGCNMAAETEYGDQRNSAQYFIGIARGMGIEVYLPRACDLLKARCLYGFDYKNDFAAKLAVRAKEFQGEMDKFTRQIEALEQKRWAYQGALDNLNYMKQNWT